MVEQHKAELGPIYPLLSHQFKAGAEQQTSQNEANAAINRARTQGDASQQGSDAVSMLRHFEGFRGQPYWDVNHWRVGYGSDTITRADGTVEPMTAFTRITQADADRDLQRRIAVTQNDIRGTIGDAAWQKLSPAAQALMTSVAYNYGHLPQLVASAAQSGDAGAVAGAISSLRAANGGVNAKRRDQEAAAVSGQFPTARGMKAIDRASTETRREKHKLA